MSQPEPEWWLAVPAQTIQSALTLAQATWWVDGEATPHLIDLMTAQHRRAVIDYLVLRSSDLFVDVQQAHVLARPGSATHRAASDLLGAGFTLADHDAWLEATPLMRRLRQLTGNSP